MIPNEPIKDFGANSFQYNGGWALDRIDQVSNTLNGSFGYHDTGAGVRIYVLDNGVRGSHNDFGGRVVGGVAILSPPGAPSGTGDCNGHGTMVASAAAGARYGVAKAATIVPVRALCTINGTQHGTLETYRQGLEWVVANHIRPAVVNMSNGVGAHAIVDSLVAELFDLGVVTVAAAGGVVSPAIDACLLSPAGAPHAVTVSSTRKTDHRDWQANYGSCVDIFAPGVDVPAAMSSSNSATGTMTGTSIAAPLVAGAIAAFLSRHPTASSAEATDSILGSALTGVVAGTVPEEGTPNRLLHIPPPIYVWNVGLTVHIPTDSGVLMTWTPVHDAYLYEVVLVVRFEEYDDYSGTSNVYDVSETVVGWTTVASIVDTVNGYTGNHECVLYSHTYGSARYLYLYEFRTSSSFTVAPMRTSALVGTCQ